MTPADSLTVLSQLHPAAQVALILSLAAVSVALIWGLFK